MALAVSTPTSDLFALRGAESGRGPSDLVPVMRDIPTALKGDFPNHHIGPA